MIGGLSVRSGGTAVLLQLPGGDDTGRHVQSHAQGGFDCQNGVAAGAGDGFDDCDKRYTVSEMQAQRCPFAVGLGRFQVDQVHRRWTRVPARRRHCMVPCSKAVAPLCSATNTKPATSDPSPCGYAMSGAFPALRAHGLLRLPGSCLPALDHDTRRHTSSRAARRRSGQPRMGIGPASP